MFHRIQSGPESPLRPQRGINAKVLVDGFSPAPPREKFELEHRFGIVASYLLEGERGFNRIIPVYQFPPPQFIYLRSKPADVDQKRLAFGLGLLADSVELGGSMAMKVDFGSGTAKRYVNVADPRSCIKFLEVLERLDELSIKYWYSDVKSGTKVSGCVFF